MQTVPTATNGRRHDGKFGPNNQAAAGRTSRAAELRRSFLAAVTPEDMVAIAAKLVEMAKAGDVACAKLVLDRLGRPGGDDDDQHDGSRNRILTMLAQPTQGASDAT